MTLPRFLEPPEPNESGHVRFWYHKDWITHLSMGLASGLLTTAVIAAILRGRPTLLKALLERK